jgi:two-component system phosphate regulon sensor histidine kinase PhoR
MSNRSIRWVIGFGVIAILAILAGQAYFFYQAFDLKKRQTEQSLKICLQSVAESICEYNQTTLPDNIIHQYTPDYFIVDINNHIDPWILEHYLRSELNRSHIRIDFEYAIYDCNDDKMMYGNYVMLDETQEKKEKLKYWPKYEEGIYYFGVHFPGMQSHLLGQMGLWYFFSGILVIVILFFGYSMMIILHQKRLSEVQRDFINNMSHEFRTPLTSISLASDVISEDGITGDPDRFRKYSEILKDQTSLLQKKVDRILQHAETEQKFFRLNKEIIPLIPLLSEISDEFRTRAEHINGSVNIEIQAQEPELLADRYHLTGVLINLLDNSLKYSVDAPIVFVRLTGLPDKLKLCIEDNGAGIDKKHIKRIFMPFYRVPSGNVHNVKGSGLGLSYVKRICDLHKWKLSIESEPGKGTKICIIMPKAKRNG